VWISQVSGVKEFFQELFHEDHNSMDRNAVVLAKGLPSSEMQALLSHPKFSFGLTYLDGNVMNPKDLKRAAASLAKTCFVLTNKFSRSPDQEDASTILRALAIKRYVQQKRNRDIQTCVQLIHPESTKLFLSSTGGAHLVDTPFQNQIVCVDEIKMNLLAKSCLCPGTSTMICNLISSSSDELPPNCGDWLREYCEGCGFEIYRVPLSPQFEGLTFLEAVQVVYEAAGSLLFALEIAPLDAKKPRHPQSGYHDYS
jgi:hypothetical protein